MWAAFSVNGNFRTKLTLLSTDLTLPGSPLVVPQVSKSSASPPCARIAKHQGVYGTRRRQVAPFPGGTIQPLGNPVPRSAAAESVALIILRSVPFFLAVAT